MEYTTIHGCTETRAIPKCDEDQKTGSGWKLGGKNTGNFKIHFV